MAEILVKAVDSKMPTAAEWRAWINGQVAGFSAYLSARVDVPLVISNWTTKLEPYLDAKRALAVSARIEAKVGTPTLTTEQKANCEARVSAYEAAPLTQAEVDKIRAYYSEDNPKRCSIVEEWRWTKRQIEVEHPRSDAEKGAELARLDRSGCYKRGDPVAVMPDGHVWGRMERLPWFFVVKIPGLGVEAAKKYLGSWDEGTGRDRKTLQMRLYRLAVDSLPTNVKNALQSTGVASLTLNAFKSNIVNQQTGVTG
jgi:hypothetical protein